MKLYLLKQEENTGYDTYDSCVVIAENETEACKIHPSEEFYKYDEKTKTFHWWCDIGKEDEQYSVEDLCLDWATKLENVRVEYLGEAKEDSVKGVVLASFNAG